MIGVVLLLIALALSVVLVLVFVAAARVRMKEREDLLAESGAGEEEIAEARKRRPPIKGWLACSGVALVLVTGAVGAVVKGCSAMGRSMQQAEDLQACKQSVRMLAEWFGPYWDQHKKLPKPADVPTSSVECPSGNDFVYVGHKKIVLNRARLLVIELQPHHDGTRHALVVKEKFLKDKKTVAQAAGVNATGGRWGGWTPNSQYFRLRSINEATYRDIREAVEKVEEEGE